MAKGGGAAELGNIKSTHPPLTIYDTLVTGMIAIGGQCIHAKYKPLLGYQLKYVNTLNTNHF